LWFWNNIVGNKKQGGAVLGYWHWERESTAAADIYRKPGWQQQLLTIYNEPGWQQQLLTIYNEPG
jgi:hypothetical protein